MIKGTWAELPFTIDNGSIKTTDVFLIQIYDHYSEPAPSPEEGDPDMAIYKRMSGDLKGFKLISYDPPKLDLKVAY